LFWVSKLLHLQQDKLPQVRRALAAGAAVVVVVAVEAAALLQRQPVPCGVPRTENRISPAPGAFAADWQISRPVSRKSTVCRLPTRQAGSFHTLPFINNCGLNRRSVCTKSLNCIAINPAPRATCGGKAIMSEFMGANRVVPFTNRPHLPENIKLFMGDGIAKWDGDSLVIETTNFNGITWLDNDGDRHSDALKLVEKFTLTNENAGTFEATFTDPKAYTAPWKISAAMARNANPNAEIMEFACVEGNKDHLVYTEAVGGRAKEAPIAAPAEFITPGGGRGGGGGGRGGPAGGAGAPGGAPGGGRGGPGGAPAGAPPATQP
jgi:hypothetical protein